MKAPRGFTLIELLMVIVITGIIAGVLTVFLGPAINSYIDTRRRSDLTDLADTALRSIAQELRSAVPNSVISHTASCFQFAPTLTGGRYRIAPEIGATGSMPLETTTPTTGFDVLSPLSPAPAIGDWVVVNNQNTSDVYTGTNRSAITSTPAISPPYGLHRILINSHQFPVGYDGGRFVVVANATQSVFYHVVGSTLYRTVGTFASGSSTCNLTTGSALATDVSSAVFVYTPNQGATQQSGFVWMRIELSRSGESAALAYGIHVSNAP